MKKSFGQHLLVDKNYLQEIINAIKPKSNDIVLEIGAGDGLLTSLLAQKVKKIYAVEPERVILKKLKENIKINKLTNVEIIEADFLKLNLNNLLESPFKVVGNIPYNITSKIILKLFGEIDKPAPHLKYLKEVYLMLQLEVAYRLAAKPNTKSYSPITLLVQYFACPEILFTVPSDAFYPVPKVDSAFVVFYLRENPQALKYPSLLKNIIRVAFQQRRKKVINALNKLFEDKSVIKNTFDKLHLNHNLRAENLDFEKFVIITNEFKHQ